MTPTLKISHELRNARRFFIDVRVDARARHPVIVVIFVVFVAVIHLFVQHVPPVLRVVHEKLRTPSVQYETLVIKRLLRLFIFIVHLDTPVVLDVVAPRRARHLFAPIRNPQCIVADTLGFNKSGNVESRVEVREVSHSCVLREQIKGFFPLRRGEPVGWPFSHHGFPHTQRTPRRRFKHVRVQVVFRFVQRLAVRLRLFRFRKVAFQFVISLNELRDFLKLTK